MGFSQKRKAKELLEKNFVIEKDYKISLYQQVKRKNKEQNHGGQNKQIYIKPKIKVGELVNKTNQ